MPIVAHSSLPSFTSLADRGLDVLSLDDALSQDIRELHIGLCNMMPDAALRVTEQQFIRLAGSASQIVQLYVHPFTVPGLARSAEAQAYIDEHYTPFEVLADQGLDGLIVSGANVSNPDLADEPFWEPLGEVMGWAHEHVTSVLCSCLATHALLQRTHGIHRRRLLAKRWGVYEHRLVAPDHPLLRDTNTRFDVPHSRWNAVTTAQLRAAGIEVLIESVEGDVHLAVSPDGFRTVYLQGHPEYDTTSLLKEYKRELGRYVEGEIDGLPPLPERYLTEDAARLASAHLEAVVAARAAGEPAPPFPEDELTPGLHNTWADTAKAVFNNWLGLIYRLTDHERGVPFMANVDPNDPIGWRTRRS
ncbi:homoserine O-succinyltransferase [Nitriliruptoraceae bacterium ZYF776]|nr:homoserine O-succinyltransferase [Profundirhabdus halotolerans]